MRIHFGKPFIAITLILFTMLSTASCSAWPWTGNQIEPTPIPTVIAPGTANADGQLLPKHVAMLGFSSGGELGEFLVEEGSTVAKGDILARLAKREALQARLSQAKYETLAAQQNLEDLQQTASLATEKAHQVLVDAQITLNKAQIALNKLDTTEFQDELDDLNIDVEDAKTEMDDAKTDLDKYLDLSLDNTTRKDAQESYDDSVRSYNEAVYDRDAKQNQLDQAKVAVDLAQAQVDEARRQHENRMTGVDPNTLALAEARVQAATDAEAAAQLALDETELTAPFDGTIIDLAKILPGEKILPGQTLITLVDLSEWVVETTDLTELDVVDIKVGQEVAVKPDALPDRELTGTVESIGAVPVLRSGDVLYKVRIRLEKGDPQLRWGMTVNVVFEP